MKRKIKYTGIISITFSLFFFFTISHGECNNIDLYGLRDKNALLGILEEKKVALQNDSNNVETLKALGIIYHNLGILRIPHASQEAFIYLEKVNKLSPTDYEVLAYLGSTKTMIARDSWNPLTKMNYVNEGIRLLDRAVDRDPNNIIIRFVRINNSLSLPGLFKRKKVAKNDLFYLLELSRERRNDFTQEMLAEIYFHLGEIYKSEGESTKANDYFKRVVDIAPDSKWAKQTKSQFLR